MTATEKKSPEAMLSDALSLLRQLYYAHVFEIAEDIDQYAKDNPEKDRDEIMQYVWESIDSDGWVIYTHKAQSVCLCSDNDGAAIDNYGPEGIVEDGSINWSRLAYSALEADVMGRLTIDINADFPGAVEDAGEE